MTLKTHSGDVRPHYEKLLIGYFTKKGKMVNIIGCIEVALLPRFHAIDSPARIIQSKHQVNLMISSSS